MSQRYRPKRAGGACNAAFSVTVLLLSLILSACPNPIPLQLASQIEDEDGPVVTLITPRSGDSYYSTVTLIGTVTDPAGSLRSLVVSAPVVDLSDAIAVDSDGAFAYTIDTKGLTGSLAITLTATDWNGNTSVMEVSLQNDLAGPSINIAIPADYSSYSTIVRVAGTITDSDESGTSEEVSACSYKVLGSSLGGELAIGDGGEFQFEFATRRPDGTPTVSGNTAVEVSASDWNGNTSTELITLVPAASGDIPGFSVVPGDGEVSFSWDDVPGAESYLIRSLTNGQVALDVTSPFTWTNLRNATVYSFQLYAEIPDAMADNAESGTVNVVPLSPSTLQPWIAATSHESVTVQWPPLASEADFIIERRPAGGAWQMHAISSQPAFPDTGVAQDTWYEYRVYPAMQSSIVSGPTCGMPSRFRADPVIGNFTGPGQASNVAVDSSVCVLGFTGGGVLEGLKLLDVSNPANISFIYQTDILLTEDIEIVGGTAYIMNNQKLRIFNVSPPGTMSLLGSFFRVYDVANYRGLGVYGNTVYGAVGSLRIYDVTDPTSPDLYGTPPALSLTEEVTVAGDRAFVANGDTGVVILDLLPDPSAPTIAHTVDTGGYAWNTQVSGDYCYVADGADGVQVIDLSLATPAVISGYDPSGVGSASITDLAQREDLLVAADGADGLRLIQVADPANPALVRTIDIGDVVRDVAMQGDLAYAAASGAGLNIVDLAGPYAPGLSETLLTAYPWNTDVAVRGDILYALSWPGLAIAEIGADGTATVLSTVGLGSSTRFVVSGSTVCAAVDFPGLDGYGFYSGFTLVDVSDPGAPGTPSGFSEEVLVDDDMSNAAHPYSDYILYVNGAGGVADGLRVFHASDLSAPVANCPTPGAARDIAVAGHYAYIADGTAGLTVVDLSDPESPEYAGDAPAGAGESYLLVRASGNLAFVALSRTAENAIRVYDLNAPAAPAPHGELVTPEITSMTVDGSYLYYTTGGGVFAVDISNPGALTPAGQSEALTECFGVAVQGATAYAAYGDGVAVLNLWEE